MTKSDKAKGERNPATLLDPKMTTLLVCPRTHGQLHFVEEKQELHSPKARLAYPVRDGIPILLPSEARPLEDDELEERHR
ncbi:MAG: Trm112 family protein [Pseudomonadota bacterium]